MNLIDRLNQVLAEHNLQAHEMKSERPDKSFEQLIDEISENIPDVEINVENLVHIAETEIQQVAETTVESHEVIPEATPETEKKNETE